jgi:predicted fused transcriptional regulator/phosphomethylpyrimidine kinase/predicted transcriptional regulator
MSRIYLREDYNSVIMYPPCLVVMEKILPELRIRVAHHLREKGYSQTRIAAFLHVSQAMISKYLSQDVPELHEAVDEVAEELAQMMIEEKDRREITLYLCQNCFRWREGGRICDLHAFSECTVCTDLRNPRIMSEKQQVIHKIKEALVILQSDPSVMEVMPEVRMNVAMALENASTPMDVAAVPGRLIPVHGIVTAVSNPEFGASHHLASILIRCGKKAVVNIRYSTVIKEAIKHTALTLSPSSDNPEDVLVDEGGFGIEPCAYVFGDDAVEAALRVRKIAGCL